MTENDAQDAAPEETAPAESAPATPAAPEEETPKVPYEIRETTDEPGSVKRFVVETSRDAYEAKTDEVYRDLRKTIVLDGFRRGKAPLGLLRKRFGKEASEDALKELAGNIVEQIVEAQGLKPVAEPSLHDGKVEDEGPAVLTIDVEVEPEIDPQGYKGEKYEVEKQAVDESLVDGQLDMIRDANAVYETVEREWKPGDGVTVDMEVVDAAGQRMESLCQENQFFAQPERALMPEVLKALEGKKAGDEFTETVERTVKNRADEEVTHKDSFSVKVREVKEKVLPALDDEFAKDVGEFETLEDLRGRIREDLEEQAESRKRQALMDQVFDKLIEANPFDAPQTLVREQEYRTIMRDTEQLRRMGLGLEAMGLDAETYMQNARVNAERFVKINRILAAVAEKENLQAGEEDVQKAIERVAEREGRKPLAVRARLEAQKGMEDFEQRVRMSKVEDFLVENNEIVEVAPKEKPAEETPE